MNIWWSPGPQLHWSNSVLRQTGKELSTGDYITADHNSNTSQNTFEFPAANKVVNKTTYKIP